MCSMEGGPFPVGSVVEITRTASMFYSNLKDLATLLHVKDYRTSDFAEEGDVGVVTGIAPHPSNGNLVLGINVEGKGGFILKCDGVRFKAEVAVPRESRSTPAELMWQMWSTRQVSADAAIVAADGEEILAHSCVLMAASPVLAAAFKAGMKESTTRRVEAPETPAATVKGTLEFLYTGVTPADLDRKEALCFAHKYQIAEVARHIAPEMIQGMSADNAAQTVRLLRDFGDSFLDAIIDFWCGNKDILKAILQGL
eukprot:TRINITY_DN68852_c0_g1_i1.p1 TRINITY_DN68852_c0_g1~~TRINITY_DN68852_c0_g1_i1.p1  ORF type:complete len:255 (+),score=50.24 TRINITY_DN68852_c0_g1_i1:70-834(+)